MFKKVLQMCSLLLIKQK